MRPARLRHHESQELDLIITITGKLVRVGETAVSIESAPFEYEVLVADYTRRQLQSHVGEQTRLHTLDYIEGNRAGAVE